MWKKTILWASAAASATAIVMLVVLIAGAFAVMEWLRGGPPTLPALIGAFGLVLVAVGGIDLVRYFVRSAVRT